MTEQHRAPRWPDVKPAEDAWSDGRIDGTGQLSRDGSYVVLGIALDEGPVIAGERRTNVRYRLSVSRAENLIAELGQAIAGIIREPPPC